MNKSMKSSPRADRRVVPVQRSPLVVQHLHHSASLRPDWQNMSIWRAAVAPPYLGRTSGFKYAWCQGRLWIVLLLRFLEGILCCSDCSHFSLFPQSCCLFLLFSSRPWLRRHSMPPQSAVWHSRNDA